MSIDEIEDKIDSFERNHKRMIKETATLNAVLVDMLSLKIAKIFDSKNELETKHLWDYFPSLFAEEKSCFEKEKEDEDFEKFKSNRRAFVQRHNKKRKEAKK